MCEHGCRHELFEAARRRAEWSITDLWVHYLALGGTLDLFTVEAYLHGLTPLPPIQQDILANALNERLDDLYRAAVVPYLHVLGGPIIGENPMEVIDDLLRPRRSDAD